MLGETNLLRPGDAFVIARLKRDLPPFGRCWRADLRSRLSEAAYFRSSNDDEEEDDDDEDGYEGGRGGSSRQVHRNRPTGGAVIVATLR